MSFLINPFIFGGGVFAALTYVGTGSSNAITGSGFLPDVVWIKNRDQTDSNQFFNDIRGANRVLVTDTTAAEVTDSTRLSSFDTDGFTVGTSILTNTNTENYVGWCFLEKTGACDLVQYLGNGTSQNVSHNLGVVPEMMIVKNHTTAQGWRVYHKDLNGGTDPEDFKLNFDTNDGEGNNATVWNDTAPTSSVFTVGSSVQTNDNGNGHINLMFASVAGISKVDKYSGTGSSGNSVTGVGFLPAFLLIKNRSTGEWVIYDSSRGDDKDLEASTNAVEGTLALTLDADGFTVNSTDANLNSSGTDNYVYLALA